MHFNTLRNDELNERSSRLVKYIVLHANHYEENGYVWIRALESLMIIYMEKICSNLGDEIDQTILMQNTVSLLESCFDEYLTRNNKESWI